MDLQKRVGVLVGVHRRRLGLTQQQLADMISMSPDMISRIETGGTGLRFGTIEKLANALAVDPAELFLASPGAAFDGRRPLLDLTAQLSGLSDADLTWVSELVSVALRRR